MVREIVVPKLVVLTGYPCTGKSRVSKYMSDELNFTTVSTDEIRHRYFGKGYAEMKKTENDASWDIVYFIKDQLLGAGLDIVFDSTAWNDTLRTYIFFTPDIDVKRYLLWLDAKRDEINRRNVGKGRKLSKLSEWDEQWNDPVASDLYTLLHYPNNTEQDLKRIEEELREIFGGVPTEYG